MIIAVTLDHATALAAYTAAGHPYPTIPAGCNTVWHPFTTTEGQPAVVVNQRGFAPEAGDNEEQVNGCLLAVAIDAPDTPATRAALAQWVAELNQP